MAVLSPVQGFNQTLIDLSAGVVTLRGSRFLMGVHETDSDDDLLVSDFILDLDVAPIMIPTERKAMLSVRVTSARIHDVSIYSDRYETTVDTGMRHVLQSAVDAYMIPRYRNETLAEGVEVFPGEETLDPKRRNLALVEVGIRVAYIPQPKSVKLDAMRRF